LYEFLHVYAHTNYDCSSRIRHRAIDFCVRQTTLSGALVCSANTFLAAAFLELVLKRSKLSKAGCKKALVVEWMKARRHATFVKEELPLEILF
jgi:hypothetical protein